MKILEVLNVGQGDCMILHPSHGCAYERGTTFVDLGTGRYNVSRHVKKDEPIHIFLSHHDSDHTGGLKYLLVDYFSQIEEITVPLYQNEVTLIAQSILKLKGIASAPDCSEFVTALNKLINNQVFLIDLLTGRETCPKLTFGYDGKWFCNHILCLNPPLSIVREETQDDSMNVLTETIHDVFEEDFANAITWYIRRRSQGETQLSDLPNLNNLLLPIDYEDTDISAERENIARSQAQLIINFIMENRQALYAFINNPSRPSLRTVYEGYIRSAHDACLVLKATYQERTFLLTGDASKKVFNRLIKEKKDISADYLKMPHHGSKNNMTEKILDKIDPDAAIISHNNGLFGAATDPYPNEEILKMLYDRCISILLTNDVIKGGKVVMRKSMYSHDPWVEI